MILIDLKGKCVQFVSKLLTEIPADAVRSNSSLIAFLISFAISISGAPHWKVFEPKQGGFATELITQIFTWRSTRQL
jgi:hypothetical protein